MISLAAQFRYAYEAMQYAEVEEELRRWASFIHEGKPDGRPTLKDLQAECWRLAEKLIEEGDVS